MQNNAVLLSEPFSAVKRWSELLLILFVPLTEPTEQEDCKKAARTAAATFSSRLLLFYTLQSEKRFKKVVESKVGISLHFSYYHYAAHRE